ncbi:MAG: hypothetical protein J5821_03285 [Alphaproteobacteria bacterium]|nr:hypothetical protein [Alphaproteobacteria bacterium]
MEKSTLKKILYVVAIVVGIKCLLSWGKFFLYENGSEHLKELSDNVVKPYKTLSVMN